MTATQQVQNLNTDTGIVALGVVFTLFVIFLVGAAIRESINRKKEERQAHEAEMRRFRAAKNKYHEFLLRNRGMRQNLQGIAEREFVLGRCAECGNKEWLFTTGMRRRQYSYLSLRCAKCEYETVVQSKEAVYPHEDWRLANDLNEIAVAAELCRSESSIQVHLQSLGISKVTSLGDIAEPFSITGGDYYTEYQITDSYDRKQLSASIQEAVRARDGEKCVLCGSAGELQFDHILPVSRGGGNQIENVRILCRACNLKKGAGSL